MRSQGANVFRRGPLPWVIVAGVLGVTLLLYWPTRHHGFITFDDPEHVQFNPVVGRGLTVEGLQWAFTTLKSGNWHPLTWISHMATVQVFGPDPGAQHLADLALHLANTLLLLLVLGALTGRLWRSAVVALLFAIHPLHVESVAWISERKDVLSTAFWLLGILAYLRGVRSGGRACSPLLLATFALGLMAKPMLVTFPFVLLLLDYWPLGRFPAAGGPGAGRGAGPGAAGLLAEKIPLFALSLTASLLAFVAQQRSEFVSSLAAIAVPARIANAVLSYATYLGQTIWPRDLGIFYPFDPARLRPLPVLAAALLLLGLSVAAIAWRRRRPYVAWGWFWYLGTLVPVIGLVQIGTQARADRYTYVPLIGIFVLIVWGGSELLARRPALRPAAAAFGLLAGAALALQTHVQIGYWSDNLTLFQHNLEVNPDEAMSLKNVGIALAAQGRGVEADRLLARANELNPSLRARPHFIWGQVQARDGKIADAARSFREALRINPNFSDARQALDQLLREHPEAVAPEGASPLERGNVLARSGRHEEAIVSYREALRLQPGLAGAYNNIGCSYATIGRYEEARSAFLEALRLQPGYADARRNLAKLPGGGR